MKRALILLAILGLLATPAMARQQLEFTPVQKHAQAQKHAAAKKHKMAKKQKKHLKKKMAKRNARKHKIAA